MKTSIGKRLKLIREKNNLTQDQVEKIFEKIGGPKSASISKYERGNQVADLEFAIAFGKYFKLNADWFFYGTGPHLQETKEAKKSPAELFQEFREAVLALKALNLRIEMPPEEEINPDNPQNFLDMLKVMLTDREAQMQMLVYYFCECRPQAMERREAESG